MILRPADVSGTAATIAVAGIAERCRVLGPGIRAVVWVQGCTLGCPGCISVDTHSKVGGVRYSPHELADELLAIGGIEGVTVSGGEPFQQADALADVLTTVRSQSALSVLCYTGFSRDGLEKARSAGIRRLLSLVDILIDGPFVQQEQETLLWRGSRNQRVHFLTDRYSASAFDLDARDGRLEVRVDVEGGLRFVGIPPAGFLHRLDETMKRQGLRLSA